MHSPKAIEETGYEVGEVRKLFELYMSPGGVTELIHFFIAEYSDSQRANAGGGVEDEDIEVLELPFSQALEMIKTGEIRDGKTVLLLNYLPNVTFNGLKNNNNISLFIIGSIRQIRLSRATCATKIRLVLFV